MIRAPRFHGLVAVLAFVVGCEAESRSPSLRPSPAPATTSAPSHTAEPLAWVERCVGAPCESALPMLVAIHGLGDTPEAFLSVYDGVRGPVRIIALRAPMPWGEGFAWFPYRARDADPASIADALRALVPRWLATFDAVCAVRACVGKPLVSGFSQGGMAAYTLAALAPDRVRDVFPVGGFLAPPIDPIASASRPRIVAWHGAADTVVSPELDVAGVNRLRDAGYDVSLRLVPGIAHAIPPAVARDLAVAIDDAIVQ